MMLKNLSQTSEQKTFSAQVTHSILRSYNNGRSFVQERNVAGSKLQMELSDQSYNDEADSRVHMRWRLVARLAELLAQ